MSSATKKISAKKSFVDLFQSNNYKKQNQQRETFIANSKSRCKSGASSKQIKQKDQMKSLLKQSYLFLKEENQSLHQKLSKKGRKIEQLKEKIKQYDMKLMGCYQTIQNYKYHCSKGAISLQTDQTIRSSRKKYQQMIRQSQQVAKKSIEKYKKLQRQLQEQKVVYEQQLMSIRKSNETYKQVIQTFKSSQRSLSGSTNKKKASSIHQARNDSEQYFEMKYLSMLNKKQEQWSRKQMEMKSMLRQLANKLTNIESSLRSSDQKSKSYRLQLTILQQKYAVKCKRHKENNQKWASVFKQLVKQIQSVGKDIETTKKLFVTILKKELALRERD